MSIKKNTFFFSIGTILSRISGLLRDSAISFAFGASPYLDAFFVASRIPNLFREMLAEGSLTGSFTKVYTELTKTSEELAKKLLADMWKLSFLFSLCFCLMGIMLAPYLVDTMTISKRALSNTTDLVQTATELTRILFPYLGLSVLGSLVMGALHQRNKFFLSATAPIALNIGYLVGIFLLGAPSVYKLAAGMLLGGAMHLAVQMKGLTPAERRSLFGGSWFDIWNSQTYRVGKIMLPASFAASTGPINLFINTNFAVMAGPGAVSWLYYSFHILHLPIGVFAVAVGSVSLPALTRALVEESKPTQNEDRIPLVAPLFSNALELLLWLMIPCFLLMFFAANNIVTLLFQHGHFSNVDTQNTALALQAYSLSLIPYGIQKLCSSFLFAKEKTRYALYVSILSLGVNASLCFMLVHKYGHVGLALASSATIICSTALLFYYIHQDESLKSKTHYFSFLLPLISAMCCSALAMNIAHSQFIKSFIDLVGIAKISSLIQILLDAMILTSVFFGFAMIRFKSSPKQLVKHFKKMRSQKI